MMARLKVYRTHLGFYETIVAAPSQAAALKVWDVRQNLFAEGAADVTDDPDAVKAALAAPGVPLKRTAGSKQPYTADPSAPALPEAGTAKREKPRPDRRALDEAEAALASVKGREAREQAELDARRRALEDELHTAQTRWRGEQKTAEAAVDRARADYRKAGGKR